MYTSSLSISTVCHARLLVSCSSIFLYNLLSSVVYSFAVEKLSLNLKIQSLICKTLTDRNVILSAKKTDEAVYTC